MVLYPSLGSFCSMGTDNLFHKLRKRAEKSFKRRAEWRKSNEVVLIVCQGKKTEPNYFRGLQAALALSNANLVILDSMHGRDALSLVRAGIKEYENDPGIYDRVYCVFDKDSDSHFQNAVQLARNHALGRKGILVATTCVPCFEIWLLLHFEFTTRQYVKSRKNSPCDNLIADLKKPGRISNYEKNHKGIYHLVGDKTATAIRHAIRLTRHNAATQSDDPSTDMHGLLAYLETIAPKQK